MKSDMLYRESESSDLQARFPLAATQEETANYAASYHCQERRPSWSDLSHAAVDAELDASDVAACVGSEKGNRLGNFVQSSPATEWYFVSDVSAYCLICSSVIPKELR
jgi:hypothetical protein